MIARQRTIAVITVVGSAQKVQVSHNDRISSAQKQRDTFSAGIQPPFMQGVTPLKHNPNVSPELLSPSVHIAPIVGFSAARTGITINNFHVQTNKYVSALINEQARLTARNDTFLQGVMSPNKPQTTTYLRNKSDWRSVKSLVVRDELMKVQMGGKTSLPLTRGEYLALAEHLDGLDLSNMSNAQVADIFNCIKSNFIEKVEIHHRTSISSDPSLQSDIDNLDVLTTSQHDSKHINPETGKVDYRRRVNESRLNRVKELNDINRRRVFRKELAGVGLAAAIGFGTGFAIGFIVSLAQNDINPNSMKYAFIAGTKQGGTSAAAATGMTLFGRTVGASASNALTKAIVSHMSSNIALQTVENIATMCNMGVVGSLAIVATSVYEFAKQKKNGFSTKECLLRTGKSAALSFSVLIISIAAQGIWMGYAGVVVSVVAGVIITGYTVAKQQHDKKVAREITFYSIELCYPTTLST